MHAPDILTGLIVVWLAAKMAGEGLQRLGQSAVVGELLAGVAIGPGALGLVAPAELYPCTAPPTP